MMAIRAAAQRSKQELPALVATQTRTFVAPLRVDFSEDVAIPKAGSKDAPSIVDEWSAKKQGTEHIMKLLQTYRELADAKAEPLLKQHNPRTFEDLLAPVPNFRAMTLKAGEVSKFFDSVLSKRADDAVQAKNAWWAHRKQEAEAAAAGKTASFAPVPVPKWQPGHSLTLDSLNKVTDSYIKSLEPKRKLALPVVPAQVKDSLESFIKQIGQGKAAPEITEMLTKALAESAAVVENGKVLDNFQYVSKAVAAKVLAKRRAEVHERYVKLWAKKVLVSPELSVVPLKEVDAQLASKFEGVAPQYAELLQAASIGKTTAERMKNMPALDSFLLKREKANIGEDFPPTEVERSGAALAAEVEDPEAALRKLLGPELQPLGSAGVPLSQQVKAITEHKYTPDRLGYREGLKLAQKYAEEEAALVEELKGVYGANVDVAHFQAHPRAPVQKLLDSLRAVQAQKAEFEAELAAASSPYLKYAVQKKQQFHADPSNLEFEEVLYPSLTEEQLEIELTELAELEAQVADAEEEELWHLTLTQQLKHIQRHFGIDLPHSVIAYMDPILFKKIDWETTHGLEDWDITLEDMGAEYAREQWGVETLSHHFLPLIRYRRAKARKAHGRFDAESVASRAL